MALQTSKEFSRMSILCELRKVSLIGDGILINNGICCTFAVNDWDNVPMCP